jgi:tetratricopeptide (TPR) repeat protein
MNTLSRTVVLFLFGLSVSLSPASSQERQHQHPAPQKLGEVSFPVSCSPAVQKPFNQAVALLHSFAYSAAEKEFRDIPQADPKCAMAHWGVAMSYYHQLWEPRISPEDLKRGQSEIRKAETETLGGTSPREQEFIDALSLFYKDAPRAPHAMRALAYQKAMGALAARYPNDRESQIFYALALLSTASPTDRSHANQKKAAAVLEPLFKQYPDHPGVAHYLIHAYDSPELASRGLPAARAYAQIAPSAPHALHMPSHIFTQLGLWQDSIASNSAARAAARQQGDIGEELHAMDYLMYAYLQAGRDAEAAQLLRELRAIPDLPVDQFKVGYAATAMPVRYAIEGRGWAEAAAIPPRLGSPPQVLAITHWCRAVSLARSGKPDAATAELEKLNRSLRQVRNTHDDYWTLQVEVQVDEAKAWIAHAQGQQDKSLALMRAAVEKEGSVEKLPVTPGPIVPAREQLGDLLLELNRPAESLREYETSLATAPGRRGSLSGAARAAEMAGDSTKAEQFKAQLRGTASARTD